MRAPPTLRPSVPQHRAATVGERHEHVWTDYGSHLCDLPRRLLWDCGSYRNHTEQNNESSEDSLHNLCIYTTVQPFAKQSIFPCIASNCASVDIKNFWLLDFKLIKNISLLYLLYVG